MRLFIKVTRKDESVRDVEIMFDRNTGKYCFVNLTSGHVCKCRFDSQEETMLDLLKDNYGWFISRYITPHTFIHKKHKLIIS